MQSSSLLDWCKNENEEFMSAVVDPKRKMFVDMSAAASIPSDPASGPSDELYTCLATHDGHMPLLLKLIPEHLQREAQLLDNAVQSENAVITVSQSHSERYAADPAPLHQGLSAATTASTSASDSVDSTNAQAPPLSDSARAIKDGLAYERGTLAPVDITAGAAALSCYAQAANLGDTEGMFLMGRSYERGDVQQDIRAALHWYNISANTGNAEGQAALGRLYHKGKGVQQDYRQALAWFKKAAAQGESNAATMLGYMHAHGQGVPRNVDEAVSWYRLAAQHGDGEGMFFLGLAYEEGQGVGVDQTEALHWYREGAALGDPDATDALQRLEREG